jgi:hypothetical protein
VIGSILSDALGHSIKLVARFLLGVAIGAGAIFGFAVATGVIPASEITLDNAEALVAEVRAKVDEVSEAWESLTPADFGNIVEAYKGNVGEVYAGPDEDSEYDSDDYGTVDSWDGLNAVGSQVEGSEESGY